VPESFELEGSKGFALGWGIENAEEKVGAYMAAYRKKGPINRWGWGPMSVSAPISVAEMSADP